MRRRYGDWGAFLSFLAILGSGGIFAGEKAPVAERPVPVTVAEAERRDVPEDIASFGHVVALETVSVHSRVTTLLKEVEVRDGQMVRAGDPMFLLDAEPFKAAADQAKATLDRDAAQMAYSAVEDRRQAALLKDKAISQDAYDQVHSTYLMAVASRDMSAAALRAAELQVGYCDIRAPLTGAISRVAIKAGNIIQANTDLLVTINRLSPIRVSFIAPESRLAAIRAAMAAGPVEVIARPGSDTAPPVEGTLSFIDNQVDTATGTITAEAEFKNADFVLWPGQYVRVTLRLGTDKGMVVVPDQAIHGGPDGRDLIAVIRPDGTADIRSCTVTRRHGKLAVIGKGVEPGEKVVLDGYLRLTEGTKVEVKPAAPPLAEGDQL